MKAWKVNVKSNHSLWSFISPEALYIWKADGANLSEINEYDEAIQMILKKGDTIFIELKGDEYVYDDKYDETFDLQRLKLVRIRTDPSGSRQLKYTIEGWTSDDIISLNDSKLRVKLSQPYSVKNIEEQEIQ